MTSLKSWRLFRILDSGSRLSKRVLLFAIGGVLLASSCTSLPTDCPKTVTTALKSPPTTGVSGILERQAKQHPGLSGFGVIHDNREAFTDRAALCKFAQKTLDIQ